MKTIKEAAMEHARTHWTGQFVQHADPRKSFMAGVKFAQRWISVEEELPNIEEGRFSELVLTNNVNNHVMLERYEPDYNQFTNIRYDSPVTHWRPIEYK